MNNYNFSLEADAGDIPYNSRRGILGAIPIYGRISYHLFNVDSNASKTKDIVKLIRKTKWHSQHGNHQSYIDTSNLLYSLEEVITGLDFNPTGEYVATMDQSVCLISDVTTNSSTFHKNIGDYKGKFDSQDLFFIAKFLAISISLTSLNSIVRSMGPLQMEHECGRITDIHEVRL